MRIFFFTLLLTATYEIKNAQNQNVVAEGHSYYNGNVDGIVRTGCGPLWLS